MARMSIIFDGFEDLAYQIDKAGLDLHAAVDDALTQTQQLIQEKLVTAALPYADKGVKGYATGKMYDAIIPDAKVEWTGTVASVRVGFDLHQADGFHSIFVMYGTPRMNKDQKVYNAIRGTRTQHAIALLQQEVMNEHLKLGGK